MMPLVLLFIALSATVTTEELEQADKLVREGAAFGQQGDFRQAILYFKSAEELAPRATHDCNIGLAYARWERYPEALYYLQRCQVRAGEDLPAWVDERVATTLTLLRHGKYADVDLAIGPMPKAEIVFDVLTSGEVFSAPIKIWLPLGKVVVTIRASGFKPMKRDVYLEHTGSQPFHFILEPDLVREKEISVVPPTKVEVLEDILQSPSEEKRETVSHSDKGVQEEAPLLEALPVQESVEDVQEEVAGGWGERSLLWLATLGAGVSVWQGIEAHRQAQKAAESPAGDAITFADASKKAALRSDLGSALLLTGLGFYVVISF
jgi:hypothetical protein